MLTAKPHPDAHKRAEPATDKPKPGKDKPAHRPASSDPLLQRLATFGGAGLAIGTNSGSMPGCTRSAGGGGLMPFLQPKLRIGGANDRFERQADRVADRVMRMPEPAIQAKPT